ncbi:MAG: DUF2092 domain-containing protein [Fimbriimonadaceae bacterium]
MLSAIFVTAVAAPDASAMLARVDEFLRSSNRLAAEFRVTDSSMPGFGTGKMTVDRPSRVRTTIRWGASSYEYINDGRHLVELDHRNRLVAESRAVRTLAPPNRLTESLGSFLPRMIVMGSVSALVPDNAKTTVTPVADGGTPTTQIRAFSEGPAGTLEITIRIDSENRPVFVKYLSDSVMGRSETTYRFSNFQVNPSLPADFFTPRIPVGYAPEFLSGFEWPRMPGEPFPTKGWNPVRGSNWVTATRNKRFLAFYGRADCAVTRRAMADFAAIDDAVRDGRISPVLLWEGAPPVTPWPVFIVTDEGRDIELTAPGTPAFWLVDDKGIVTHLWYGWNASIRRDLMAALRKK